MVKLAQIVLFILMIGVNIIAPTMDLFLQQKILMVLKQLTPYTQSFHSNFVL